MFLPIPDAVIYEEAWRIDVSAWNDSTNAKVFCFNCNFTGVTEITVSGDHFKTLGSHSTTEITWSNEPRSKLIITHDITVHDRISTLNMSTLPPVAVRNETVPELAVWLFDGTDVVVSVDWNDGSVASMYFVALPDITVIRFAHAYQSTGTYTVTGTASNLVSRIAMQNQTVTVYERIHDLIFSGDRTLVIPNEIGLWTVAAGPDQLPLENIVCVWSMGKNHGDTTYGVSVINATVSHQRAFSYGQVYVSRVTVTVDCSNAASSQNLTMEVNFLVDTAAMSCVDVAIPDTVIYEQPWRINISAWNDSTNGRMFCFNCNFTGATEITVNGDHFESTGTHNTTSVVWVNELRSKLIIAHVIAVHERISLNVSTLPFTAVRKETVLELVAWLLGGTDVVVSADWNDGSSSSMFFVAVPEIIVIKFTHTYQSTGTYTVAGFASNLLGRIVIPNQTVVVYERILDLIMYGNSSLITPPADGLWGLAAGVDQPPLGNVDCAWKMGKDYGHTGYTVAMLNSTMSHQIEFSYGQVGVSRETVSVNCSNAVSSQSLVMDVNFLVDTTAMSCVDLSVPDAVKATPIR